MATQFRGVIPPVDRELKAFKRVELEPGEAKTVTFEIPVANCTIRLLSEQRAATGAVPSDRTLIVERTRDEDGGLVLGLGQGGYFGELALAPVGLPGDSYWIVRQFRF